MQQAKGNREGASEGDENQRQCGKHLESLWGKVVQRILKLFQMLLIKIRIFESNITEATC